MTKPKRNIHLPRPSSRMENVLTWTSIVVVLIAATALAVALVKYPEAVDELIRKIVD